MKPAVAIYTDGGADPNPGPGGWGAVLLHPETGKTRELSGGEPATTNNRMELTAAIEALSSLKQPCAVELYTDSQYLRRGITEWLPGWRRKNWKKSDGTPVLNADLWQRLSNAAARHEIDWHWVKGHAGHQHNERADELATAAMRALPGVEKARPSFDVEVFLKVSGGNPGAWAALVRRDGEEQVASATGLAATSNLLDVLAAAETLEKIPPGPSIAVYTVSDYLRNGATQWLAGWRQRRWKTTTGEAVKNAAAWRRLDAALGRRQVAWPVVKGELSPELKQLEKVLKEAQKR